MKLRPGQDKRGLLIITSPKVLWQKLSFLFLGVWLVVEITPSASAEDGVPSGLGLLEAVEILLRNDPNIALAETRVDFARGALLQASGAFDPVLGITSTKSDLETPTGVGSANETSTLTSDFDLGLQLRSGLLLTPQIELEQDASGSGAVNRATVSFSFRQPLMRGRGRAITTTEERAAARESEASLLDLEHRIAERLQVMVEQYWTVRAAMYDLEVLRATEQSSRELLETTRRLIAADVTPAAEIVQLEADLVLREANRLAGEQALFRAQQDFGRELGLEAKEISNLPLPGDPFPTLEQHALPPESTSRALIARAEARRADLRAQRQRLEANEIRLRAAENALGPELDLVFTPSYSGLSTGSSAGELFGPLFSNVPGFSTTLGLSLSLPIFNRRAIGSHLQAESNVRQEALAVELTTKALGAEVSISFDAVRRNVEQLIRITEATGYFEKALQNEIKKLRGGSSTLIDVISQRDRLTSAQQREISSRLALARALLALRFQTGTLIDSGQDGRALRREQLTTLPF